MGRKLPERIDMIALDLDGTTLCGGRISPRTKQALETALERGVQVVIATGRTFASLPEDVFQIENLRYVLTSNGAILTDLRTNKVVYENCIGEDAAKEVLGILKEHMEFPIEVFTDGKAYISREIYEELENFGDACSYISREYTLRTRKSVDDIYEHMERHIGNLENVNVQFRNDDERKFMRTHLAKVDGITLTASTKHNIEIGGETTSKASGLAALCEMIGLDLKYAMACGDSHNDAAMLAECGLGIAMENGEEEVKAMADYISMSNEEEGVAHAVEKFVLGV